MLTGRVTDWGGAEFDDDDDGDRDGRKGTVSSLTNYNHRTQQLRR